MRTLSTLFVVLIFAGLGALHLYWACGGNRGRGAAIPSVDGTAVFVPGRFGTAMVAIALLGAAFVVAASGGLISATLPAPALTALTGLLALAFAIRAVGDFRLVGFFKRPNASTFARLDTLLYSPLCALLALIIFFILVTR